MILALGSSQRDMFSAFSFHAKGCIFFGHSAMNVNGQGSPRVLFSRPPAIFKTEMACDMLKNTAAFSQSTMSNFFARRKNDDFEDVQRAEPMLFSEGPSVDREVETFRVLSTSSVQRGQNVIDNFQEVQDELYDNQQSPKKGEKKN